MVDSRLALQGTTQKSVHKGDVSSMRKPLAVIGMSPGNSYFKDSEVRFLLAECMQRFGECAVMVADVPAIATYVALGYDQRKARNKALPKGNNLKNRTRRLAADLGYDEKQVRIVDWAEEVELNPQYIQHYRAIVDKYRSLNAFADSVRKTSREVLENSSRNINVDLATESATHYLLSELAFMEFAPAFFQTKRVCYVYHRNWQVYEDYISGRFDNVSKPQLDFLLLEAPYETYSKVQGEESSSGCSLHDTYSRVFRSGILRAAYVDYPPVVSRQGATFSGIFVDIISAFANKHQLQIDWVEETGYGVVINGLAEGRFDIFCSATWPTPERHKHAALSTPVYYSDVGIWVRKDSPLADEDWIVLNDPEYRIAVTEGDITHEICLTDFTFAKWIRAPQLGKVKALLEFVADGRADATMAERMTYEAYRAALPAELVNIATAKPIRRYPNCFLVGKDQHDFLELLNAHLGEIITDGELRRIVLRNTNGTDVGIQLSIGTRPR